MPVVLLGACATTPSKTNLQRFEFNETEMGVKFGLKFYARDISVARRAAREAYSRIEALTKFLATMNLVANLTG